MEVGLPDAELDDIGETADEIGLAVLFLYISQDGVKAVHIVLPVLREEFSNSFLGEELLHQSGLLYVFALHLLHLQCLTRSLLPELLQGL